MHEKSVSQPGLLLTGNSAGLATILLAVGDPPGRTGTRSKMPTLLGSSRLSPVTLPSAASTEESHTAEPTPPGSLRPAAPAQGSRARLPSSPEPQGRVAALLCWSQRALLCRGHRGARGSFLPLRNIDTFLAKRLATTDLEHFPLMRVKPAAEIRNLLPTIINHWLSLYKPFIILISHDPTSRFMLPKEKNLLRL